MTTPSVTTEEFVQIVGEEDIVVARQRARMFAKELGFGMVDQSRIATAVSELARNVVRYATNGAGEVRIRVIEPTSNRTGIEVVVRDEGPGIADIEEALRPGFSSGQGMGMGLVGTHRLMDEMKIDSGVDQPTIVTIRKWIR
jgi:serine/threonine-protein kinase RsbT